MSPVANLFDNISSYKSSFSERLGVGPILIYGAGNTGRAVASYLTLNNYQIDGFIDKNATDTQVCLKIPVLTLSEAFKRYGASVTVLVAIHNRSVDIVGLLEDIESVGFKNVFSMYDYAKTFPDDRAFRYFLGDPCSLINEKESAEKFFSMLADDSSKHIYLDLLKFRLSGNYTFCPKPSSTQSILTLGFSSLAKSYAIN